LPGTSEISSDREFRVLIVIPARGGSKGIPRKNLRPLAGRPLIEYAIRTALASRFSPDVYVSSDDEEILQLARKFGAREHRRSAPNAADQATLDPVIFEAYRAIARDAARRYDLVVTLQPTSPLLSTASLDAAIEHMRARPQTATLIAACDDTHLTWRREDGRFVPNYAARVNRQQLPPVFREAGAFLMTRPEFVTATSRIGPSVELFLLQGPERIDIDSYEDWSVCEFYLRRKKLLFFVRGYPEIGLGHVYNALQVAGDLVEHEVLFMVDERSALAHRKIAEKNYAVVQQAGGDLVAQIAAHRPDVVVNDCLDTEAAYVQALKQAGCQVINFEDLGPGARHADLVINAIYPERTAPANHYYGPAYFCLRDEFLATSPRPMSASVRRVLVTFGGVDPANLTRKVLEAIVPFCAARGIEVHVVTGYGYAHPDSLDAFPGIRVFRDSQTMSDHMAAADICFTSAGRTLFELASLLVPSVVLAQNEREMTHLFGTPDNGFATLGLGRECAPHAILAALRSLVDEPARRADMRRRMEATDLRHGRRNVMNLIRAALGRSA
jgi:CMP-N-acetylneuraminic acid synthetase/spore coat polysaccharide biosynthesis predicted glycosyltransferase SpsG